MFASLPSATFIESAWRVQCEVVELGLAVAGLTIEGAHHEWDHHSAFETLLGGQAGSNTGSSYGVHEDGRHPMTGS